MTLQAIKWNNGKLEILDQLLLPLHSNYIEITGVKDGWNAIYKMQVRGAPAIAIVGCLSLVTEIELIPYADKKSLLQDIKDKLEYLITARPTAVNIKLAADELICLATKLSNEIISPADMKESLVAEKLFYETRDSPPESKPRAARWFVNKPFRTRVIRHITSMLKKDVEDNESIGEYGATEILKLNPNQNLVTIITHCNTGSLATAGYGTALGVVRSLHNSGKLEQVYCTETRPYNQGARLTAYELVHDKIPSTLICDNMVASLMRTKKISAVVVGADRVVANGDTANKIDCRISKISQSPIFHCCSLHDY